MTWLICARRSSWASQKAPVGFRKLWAFLGALLLSAMWVRSAVATDELLAQFIEDYPAASRALEERYSKVTLSGSMTRDKESGDRFFTSHFEILRNDECLSLKQTILESFSDNLAVGTVTVSASNAEKQFAVEKRVDAGDQAISKFGKTQEDNSAKRTSCFAAFAPYQVNFSTTPLRTELLDAPDRHVISVERISGDVLEVVTERHNPKGEAVHDRYFFLPDSYALVGWSVDATRPGFIEKWRGEVVYRNRDPLDLTSVDIWRESAVKPSIKSNRSFFGVQDLEFGPVSPEKFTLARLGIPEPVPPSAFRTRLWLIIFNVAVIFFILGVSTYLRRRRINSLVN